ncbi:hypothetical protein COO60DRAFT_832409 [Scenedesmus sp. NREL 46B-D3]|nr:hypothetical protein COO60DRAFT_832409 [Scenedesmus sp. NREL 46B-D3]
MLLDLPSECVLRVLKEMPVADVVSFGCSCSVLQALVADDAFWRDLAEAKWGSVVHQLKPLADADAQQRRSNTNSNAAVCQLSDQAEQYAVVCAGTPAAAPAPAAPAAAGQGTGPGGSWQLYCCKRMCLKTIRASPLCLLQECYPDPWMHITCCVLCSRTSGSATIRECIARFFEAFPSPTACLRGCPQAMAALLHPLGLTQARTAAVAAVSQGFLGTDWQQPSDFKGCGKFVTDSWRVFCKGTRDARGVDDAKLKQYITWALRQQQAGSDQAGGQELTAEEEATAATGSRKRHKRVRGSAQASKHQQSPKCADTATVQRRTRAQAKAAEAGCAASAAAAHEGGAKRAGAAASRYSTCSRGGTQCSRSCAERHRYSAVS